VIRLSAAGAFLSLQDRRDHRGHGHDQCRLNGHPPPDTSRKTYASRFTNPRVRRPSRHRIPPDCGRLFDARPRLTILWRDDKNATRQRFPPPLANWRPGKRHGVLAATCPSACSRYSRASRRFETIRNWR
jgi:hypothetical protein